MRIFYSVNNLRRLLSVPPIELRPLTILLGRNSAGKSTFLRSISLLRQSIETNASAPILWYGDYVDFGNYKSAVSDNDVSNEITFSFEIDNFKRYINRPSRFVIKNRLTSSRVVEYGQVGIEYKVGGDESGTYRAAICLRIADIDTTISLLFDPRTSFAKDISLDGDIFRGISGLYRIYVPNEQLFGRPIFFSEGKEGTFTHESTRDVFRKLIEKEIGNFDARISRRRTLGEAERILSHRTINAESIRELAKADTQTFRQFYSNLSHTSRVPTRRRLDDICRAYHAFEVLDAACLTLTSFFKSVEYIGPARARSERFYRQQELEVSEISPDGRNLPMFLASLDAFSLTSFSGWVERIFGYGVSVHKTEGHISINLEHGGKSVNVLDTGYGVSQVLPVLTQIWWMQQPDRYRRDSVTTGRVDVKTLLIEQPELHLHPAHQALLADVFVDALKESTTPVSFVVETHSESLINRLGELIALGHIPAESVQIAIFGDDLDEESQQVKVSTFGDDGVLQNWPYGFFNY